MNLSCVRPVWWVRPRAWWKYQQLNSKCCNCNCSQHQLGSTSGMEQQNQRPALQCACKPWSWFWLLGLQVQTGACIEGLRTWQARDPAHAPPPGHAATTLNDDCMAWPAGCSMRPYYTTPGLVQSVEHSREQVRRRRVRSFSKSCRHQTCISQSRIVVDVWLLLGVAHFFESPAGSSLVRWTSELMHITIQEKWLSMQHAAQAPAPPHSRNGKHVQVH